MCMFICDQICQKGSYTCAVSSLTLHRHSTDTTIDYQFMLIPLPKVQWSTFTGVRLGIDVTTFCDMELKTA